MATIRWSAQLNFISDVVVVSRYLHDLHLPVLSSRLGT